MKKKMISLFSIIVFFGVLSSAINSYAEEINQELQEQVVNSEIIFSLYSSKSISLYFVFTLSNSSTIAVMGKTLLLKNLTEKKYKNF